MRIGQKGEAGLDDRWHRVSQIFILSVLPKFPLQSRAVPSMPTSSQVPPKPSPPQREGWRSLLIRLNGAGPKALANIQVKFWISWFQALQWFPVLHTYPSWYCHGLWHMCLMGLLPWIFPLQESFFETHVTVYEWGYPFVYSKVLLFCSWMFYGHPYSTQTFSKRKRGKEEKKEWRKPIG